MTKLTADELAAQTLDAARYGTGGDSWINRLLAQEARDLDDLLKQLNADADPDRQRAGQLLTQADDRRRAARGIPPIPADPELDELLEG